MMNKGSTASRYLFLFVCSLLFVIPFGYAMYTSLLEKQDIDKLVPFSRWTLNNYIEIVFTSDLSMWYLNSILITTGILIGNLIVNTMAAYSLSRLHYPG